MDFLPRVEFGRTYVLNIDLTADEHLWADMENWLSPDEVSRANRFLLPELRRRYVVCRGRLRAELAAQLSTSPQSLRFEYTQWGKPHLATLPRSVTGSALGLHFNLSHSGDQALIALSDNPVGVDIEQFNERFRYRSIASQVLSETEIPTWEKIRPALRNDEMMRLWVCKEALLKAMGLGIAEGLAKVSFPLPIPGGDAFQPLQIDPTLQIHLDDDGSCSMTSWVDPSTWSVQLLDLGKGLFAAIVTMRGSQIVHLHPE